jgi:hypothetical protein
VITTVVAMLTVRCSPLWLIALGGVIGASGLV